jgi:hypothetical protein
MGIASHIFEMYRVTVCDRKNFDNIKQEIHGVFPRRKKLDDSRCKRW